MNEGIWEDMREHLMGLTTKQLRQLAKDEGISLGYASSRKDSAVAEIVSQRRHRALTGEVVTTGEEASDRDWCREYGSLRGGWSSGECYYTIIHAIGLPDTSREDGGAALYSLLADLIDPDCEEGRYSVARTVRPVDREALLALAEEAKKNAWYFALDHDEDELRDRLAEVAEDFSDMVRSIREACGVVA